MERDDLPSNDKRIYLMLILLQYAFSAMLTLSKACLAQLSLVALPESSNILGIDTIY